MTSAETVVLATHTAFKTGDGVIAVILSNRTTNALQSVVPTCDVCTVYQLTVINVHM